MEQRTVDWSEWRSAGLGSSDAPVIMGVSPWSTPYQLWEEKTGRVKRDKSNWATQRGVDMEPRARGRIELDLGMDFPALLFQHPQFPFMRASLDGWNQEHKIVLEIKCPGREDHAKASHGEIPEKYYPQLQEQLFVTGGTKAFYYSYAEDENKVGSGFLVEVFPDLPYQKIMFDKMLKFWKCVCEDIEPEITDRDYKNIKNAELFALLEDWNDNKKTVTVLEKRLENIKEKILDNPLVKNNRVKCGMYRIGITTRKGNIQYAKIPELAGIDLEKFRSKPSVYQTITVKEE